MKHLGKFKKLFKLKVPCDEHFEYYMTLLSKTYKYKNIFELIEMYESADNSHDDFSNFSFKKSLEIIDFFKESTVYQKLITDKMDFDKKSLKFIPEENIRYLSIDLNKANWQVFKKLDMINELPDSYDMLMDKFNVPDVLRHSKSWRQVIFGNLNPKRQQSHQQRMMQYVEQQMSIRSEFLYDLCSIKNDEIVVKNFGAALIDFLQNLDIDISLTEYEITSIKDNISPEIKIHNYYEVGTDNLIYKDLFGSNGNQYYMNLKKYILNEDIELRDLYFKDNGQLAIWANDMELLKSLL